jgi:hypothetical protein
MKTLPATDLHCIMEWLSHLDYPWCRPEMLVSNAPDIDSLEEVIQYVTANIPTCSSPVDGSSLSQ